MKLENYLVSEKESIVETMKKIDCNASGHVFVCRDRILVAVVTDGDIRRSLLKGININSSIDLIANYSPLFLAEENSSTAHNFMKAHSISVVPIIDKNRELVDIKFLLKNDEIVKGNLKTQVVIMAGGKGKRLKPYTDILPKPLIPIGEKTITEHILEHFENYGCEEFLMIVNYKKNFIKSYFAESEVQRNLNFVEEETFQGTGGGLFLVKDKIKDTFFMTNCDVIIQCDYSKLLQYHKKQKAIITIVCARKKVVMPYGTVEVSKEGYALNFREKPKFEFNTSTGLYVIEPEFLNKIKPNSIIDITELIQNAIENDEKVGVYLIHEDEWMDMGQIEELEKMKEKMRI